MSENSLTDGFDEWLEQFPCHHPGDPWWMLERDYINCGPEHASKQLVGMLRHVWVVSRARMNEPKQAQDLARI